MSSRNRERIGKINELSSFISENNRRIDKLLADLQWDRDTLKNTDVTMTTCPVDESHRVPSKSLDKHKELCSWIQQGYTREDYDNQLPSSHFYYKDSLSVVPVLIDKTLQSQILSSTPGSNVKDVAKTNHRAELDLTCQERVAIYDYVVDKAKKMNKKSVSVSQLEFDHAAMNQDSDAKSKSKSKLEILAELRDYKRRRQSYRGKNVHITRKSNTETSLFRRTPVPAVTPPLAWGRPRLKLVTPGLLGDLGHETPTGMLVAKTPFSDSVSHAIGVMQNIISPGDTMYIPPPSILKQSLTVASTLMGSQALGSRLTPPARLPWSTRALSVTDGAQTVLRDDHWSAVEEVTPKAPGWGNLLHNPFRWTKRYPIGAISDSDPNSRDETRSPRLDPKAPSPDPCTTNLLTG
ncbi:uncharacterized protein LOC102801382 [Saccoglossus kowalevskii]|uniref:Uncharacterized protein LOC102801382 n=1 Tax=Saccoglossus kowalevskii TaxID=10224 RepID=A0ABM0MSW1_SACKO|nr:PREDICTED: uncharacterized protein LOC102801382 [Saccoglossus kowalevskii]